MMIKSLAAGDLVMCMSREQETPRGIVNNQTRSPQGLRVNSP